MSSIYAVIQVCPERRYDYKHDTIREEFSVGMPFVFSDRKRAYQEAEKKRKAKVPCFVKEFPYNPLDGKVETLEAKVKSDADYIADLERSVEELEPEVKGLRELAENLLMAFLVLETPEEQRECIDRALELRRKLNVLPMESFDWSEA